MTTDLSFERAFENDKFYSHALNRACYEEVVGGGMVHGMKITRDVV